MVKIKTSTDSRASLAVAIIAKNAGKTITACVKSLAPYCKQIVVCVDSTSTDNTTFMARKAGAEVHVNHPVSDWHECPDHGKVLVQHFANARNVSFAHLRKDVTWHMWVDADDIVSGAEKLPRLLASLGPEVDGVWLPYDYSRTPDGQVTTQFDRERIVRVGLQWTWKYRVHEVLVPVGKPTEHMNWTRTDDIRVIHQDIGHDTKASAMRNLLLCQIDIEENPTDARAMFYLGNQYFALDDWRNAAMWYERSLNNDNPYQLWQTWLYISMAYEKMGDIETSTNAALEAMKVIPYHPEPYLRLAITEGLFKNNVDACEFYTRLARSMKDPPYYAFKNPMDKTFNSHMTLGGTYANNGMITKARMEMESAARYSQTPMVMENIKLFKEQEADAEKANAWVAVLQDSPEVIHVPENLWRFGRIRDIVIPRLLSSRPNTQPRIAFWCGQSVEPWAPPSINKTGIGGSETAVIKIADRFAKAGWQVDVYNNPDAYEGEHDGVYYLGLNRWEAKPADVFVSWRNPQLPPEMRIGKVNLLWCHDLNRGPDEAGAHMCWDRVLGVSQWHADYLAHTYNLHMTSYVPNGIELDRFNATKKTPFRCVYASSPDRGLDRLLAIWPAIRANEPTAELHIAYGWDTIDKYIAMGHVHYIAFKQQIERLIAKTPGVVWRGRLPQDELAKLYAESYLWLYPTDFLEVSCISAMEAMAAGCVPVVSAAGALPETISTGGLVVSGNVYTAAWREYYLSIAQAALHTRDIRQEYMAKGRERAQQLTWDISFAEHWLPLVTSLLDTTKLITNSTLMLTSNLGPTDNHRERRSTPAVATLA